MKARKSAQVASYSCRLLIGAMSLRIASAEGTKAVLVAPPGRSEAILEEDTCWLASSKAVVVAPPGRSKAILEEDTWLASSKAVVVAPPGRSKAILEVDDWIAPSE